MALYLKSGKNSYVKLVPRGEEAKKAEKFLLEILKAQKEAELERKKPHVYQSDGASRDPSCKICGLDSWNDKTCFGSLTTMKLKLDNDRLRRQLKKDRPKKKGIRLAMGVEPPGY